MRVNSVFGYLLPSSPVVMQRRNEGMRIPAPEYSMRPPVDRVEFTSNSDVIENLIVKDLRNYHYYLKDMDRFSSNLKKLGHSISEYSFVENGITTYTIKNSSANSVIKIDIDEKKYKNIKPGFVLGKTGFYATLDVSEKNGDGYIIEVFDNSVFDNKNGLRVENKKLNSPSFTGKEEPTTTVNAYYKSEKTIKSIQRFFKLVNESPLFNSIEKSQKPYYEKFHPYILAGGFGSRIEALSYGREDNKPSTATPVKGMDLMHFSLLNLYQANLLPKSTDDVDFVIQDEANSAVGCVITTLGYKIKNNLDGVDLVKDGKSVLPKGKSVIILPSDNVIDINLPEVLDDYMNTKNAGMMIVGVPDYRCYGGLIRADENGKIKEFLYKPSMETIDENDDYLYKTDENGKKEYLLDKNGRKTALSNAFIYIINPEIIDTVANIYKNKIRNAYETLIWDKGGVKKPISREEYLKVIECLWDREIIPTLVEMSNQGKLKNKNGENLNVVVHRAMDTDYSDVGECSSYIATMKNLAKEDAYLNIPPSIKDEVRSNVSEHVIFNTDAKRSFYKLLGDGYVDGDIVVIPKD
ncbi:hypothetical protein IJ596_03445 [bacterium]|nr:hypothetical protein [bacterium]